MADLMIVWPPAQSSGLLIHLYVEGYLPGRKERSVKDAALCGLFAHTMTWRIKDSSLPQSEWVRVDVPTGRWHQPFAEGWEFVKPPWRWCPICLGRALDRGGLAGAAAGLLAAQPVDDSV